LAEGVVDFRLRIIAAGGKSAYLAIRHLGETVWLGGCLKIEPICDVIALADDQCGEITAVEGLCVEEGRPYSIFIYTVVFALKLKKITGKPHGVLSRLEVCSEGSSFLECYSVEW
jgi:hypothetical protein